MPINDLELLPDEPGIVGIRIRSDLRNAGTVLVLAGKVEAVVFVVETLASESLSELRNAGTEVGTSSGTDRTGGIGTDKATRGSTTMASPVGIGLEAEDSGDCMKVNSVVTSETFVLKNWCRVISWKYSSRHRAN